MAMCWFTPKSFDGSSEKFEIAMFGLWSQSESDSKGDVEKDAEDGDRLETTLYSNSGVKKLNIADPRKGVFEVGRDRIERRRAEEGSLTRGEKQAWARQRELELVLRGVNI